MTKEAPNGTHHSRGTAFLEARGDSMRLSNDISHVGNLSMAFAAKGPALVTMFGQIL